MTKHTVIIILAVAVALASVSWYIFTREEKEEKPTVQIPNRMRLKSPSFDNNQAIPPKYTCDGENVNPALTMKPPPARRLGVSFRKG